ncbi:MAG TPA: CAP domain-containing protein [Terracidiphilus sp.]|nr:CAP domain-containing protein [Terracidiphilus sp.]
MIMEMVRRRALALLMVVGVLMGAGAAATAKAQMKPGAQGEAKLMPAAGEQLFALANHARAQVEADRLQWDASLAEAARQHCMRMVQEGPIAHRYGGEPSLEERAAAAGAHFTLIEENVALGPTAAEIHDGWMNSPGHRDNLLSRSINAVGIAVVSSNGLLYAVADYARVVPQLGKAQIEQRVEQLIRPSGVQVERQSDLAREACASDHGIPAGRDGSQPRFVMRWQAGDLSHLPKQLVDRLASGQYRRAEVGSCQARDVEGGFAAYRVAVLLY